MNFRECCVRWLGGKDTSPSLLWAIKAGTSLIWSVSRGARGRRMPSVIVQGSLFPYGWILPRDLWSCFPGDRIKKIWIAALSCHRRARTPASLDKQRPPRHPLFNFIPTSACIKAVAFHAAPFDTHVARDAKKTRARLNRTVFSSCSESVYKVTFNLAVPGSLLLSRKVAPEGKGGIRGNSWEQEVIDGRSFGIPPEWSMKV